MRSNKLSELQKVIVGSSLGMAVILTAWLFLVTPSNTTSGYSNAPAGSSSLKVSPIPSADFNSTDLLEQHNSIRRVYGANALQYEPKLALSANYKCQDMQDNNYWAHDNPKATYTWTFWLHKAGNDYYHMAENLYQGGSQTQTMAQVTSLWLNSAGHRANIVDPQNRYAGFAECYGSLGRIIVAHFGG